MKAFKICLTILFIILLLLLSGGYFFFWQGIYWPKSPESPEEILFKIEKGENLFSISKNLEKAGLIRHSIFFQAYVLFKKEHQNLQVGRYLLSPTMSVSEIGKKIFQGENAEVKVTIPEGFTVKQIEERINSAFTEAFASAMADKQLLSIREEKVAQYKKDYDFLLGVPDDFNLEGFLFPDTYDFEIGMDSEEMVRKMLDNFDKKLTPQLREEIKEQGKTIFDIVIMASLSEKEVKSLEDKELISGILWKRQDYDIFLQVDATISFITDKKTTKISIEETQIDSPYNTYKYKGLPIGPICNPGLDSITAAIHPEDSDFWYYLSIPEGKTIYSKTFKEHILAKDEYLK